MSRGWRFACAVLAVGLSVPLAGQELAVPSSPGDAASLLSAFQAVVQRGDVEGYLRLLAPGADGPRSLAFARGLFGAGPATRVAVVQRDRVPRLFGSAGAGQRLAVDVLIEKGSHAGIYTCQIDVVPPRAERPPGAEVGPWQILDAEPLANLEGLDRLTIDPTTQFHVRNLVVRGKDMELALADGRMFVARSGASVTAVVLIGDGEMTFHPSSPVERGQVRIFSGSESLQARFDTVYLRLPAAEADQLFPPETLTAEAVDRRLIERAVEVFRVDADKSYLINLGDLSADRWWVQPMPGDLVAEVRTKRFGALTYARSWQEQEDVTLFDRQRRRHIAVYASPEKLAERGRFYDDRDGSDYRVLHYDVDTAVMPDRQWIQGRTRLHLKTLKDRVGRLTLRLADSLEVESISTAQYGRLLGLRVRNHNSILVSLPRPVPLGTLLDVTVSYKGRLAPQAPERDGSQQHPLLAEDADDPGPMPLEASFLYSNRSFWYAQSVDEDYATAAITIHLPAEYACVGSGEMATAEPLVSGVVGQSGPSAAQRVYQFNATRPVKYLSFVVSKFIHLEQASAPGTSPRLSAEVTSRFRGEGQSLMVQAAAMARLYTELTGASPYPSFTLALVEDDLPGGHSPPYFAVLHRVGRAGRPNLSWSNDPASFTGFPEYFLAHELAHQWWGQAVGTKNYHEQWISEGFAQYFAALYAERTRGLDAYRTIIRQFRKSAMDKSADGPIYLGARLGHIQGDSRIFRALVYNKGALVLHMLRLLLGDEAFFRGLRRFYTDFQFRKAGTDDVRRAFEAEAGRSLEQFFEGWVYGESLPSLAVTTRVELVSGGSAVTIRVEQGLTVFDVPITVALDLADGSTRTVVMPLTGRITEHRVQVGQPVRRASVVEAELAATVRIG